MPTTALFSTWLAFLVPLAVVVSVWLPEFAHYYAARPDVPAETVEALRSVPDDQLLAEISSYRLNPSWAKLSDAEAVVAADQVLAGTVQVEDDEIAVVSWPFAADDLERGSSSWQLHFASFAVPEVLLKAYDLTREDLYFERALEFILTWARFENGAWLPRGLLWNDHAIVERIYVLVDLWHRYRHHPRYDPVAANVIIGLIQRNAEMLAKPGHFTFATNHGVMQNLALMHAGLALPLLPKASDYAAVGRTRIQKQFDFLLSPEGPVLEHSAAYHRFGLGLVGMFARYMMLGGQPLPLDWRQRYTKAMDFFALLRRPDGTLPLLGDTPAEADERSPLVFPGSPLDFTQPLSVRTNWKPDRSTSVFPVSGYSIWWNGLADWPDVRNLSQLLVTWSHFPGHGHQRAEDLSVLFWAGGQTWWTNTGYWAYSHPARLVAESWEGSGAPHAEGEPARNKRTTAVKGFGQVGEVRAIDLERKTDDGLTVRRQVIQASPQLWLVLDQTEDRKERPVIATWTTFPDIDLKRGDLPNSFLFKSQRKPTTMDVAVLGSDGVTVRQRKGGKQPLAGWVFVGGKAAPANALMVTHQRNKDWSAVVWALGADGKPALITAPRINWRDPENWGADVGLASGKLDVSRQGNAVQVGDTRLDIQPALDASPARQAIENAYSALEREFPKFANVPAYRAKVTYALLVVLASQSAAYLLVRRRFPRPATVLLAITVPAWLAGAVWLHAVYFRV